jgi:hypothetical protein
VSVAVLGGLLAGPGVLADRRDFQMTASVALYLADLPEPSDPQPDFGLTRLPVLELVDRGGDLGDVSGHAGRSRHRAGVSSWSVGVPSGGKCMAAWTGAVEGRKFSKAHWSE